MTEPTPEARELIDRAVADHREAVAALNSVAEYLTDQRPVDSLIDELETLCAVELADRITDAMDRTIAANLSKPGET